MERRSSTSTANRALSALLLVVAGLAFAVACTKPHAEPEPVKADYAPNLAGDVTGPAAFNVVSKLAGVALPTPPGSGTTALVDTTGVLSWGSAPAVISPGTSGQIYQSNAVPAAVWVTETGDCTLSATGVQTCTQLQGGEITAGASTGTLTCNGGATACGLTQNSQSGAIPNVMDIIPQGLTNANGNGGDLLIKLPALSGSGTAGYLGLDLAGTGVIANSGTIRSNSALQWSYRNAGNTADASLLTLTGGASLSIGNVGTINTTAILGFGPVYMEDGSNDYYQLQGGVISEAIANTVVRYVSSAGQQFFHAAPDFGSGVGVVGLGVATTAPEAAPTTAGDAIIWSGTSPDAIHFINHSDAAPYSSAIGWDSTISGDALWLDPQTTGTFVDGTIAIGVSSAGNTSVNTGTSGFLTVGGGTSAKQLLWNGSGIELFTGTADFGGGTAVLGVAGAGTVPTTNPGSGHSILFSTNTTGVNSNAGFNFRGYSGTITTIPP